MDPSRESALQDNSSSSLSAEELEGWTLLDHSPRRKKMEPEETTKADRRPEKEQESDKEEEKGEEGSGSEAEAEDEEEEVPVDKSSKPSGVEPVITKPKQTKSETVARDENDEDDCVVETDSRREKRSDSNASEHSFNGTSLDGDENEHSHSTIYIKYHHPSSAQLTPPLSPQLEDERSTDRSKQLKRKRSHDEVAEATALVPEDAVVPWRHINRTSSFVLLSILMTAIAAILVGNSRMYEDRSEYRASFETFNHEQRLSELELENTLLKNEMNNLKHLYTQAELEEQVRKAEFEWMKAEIQEEMQKSQSTVEPEPQPEAEPSTTTAESKPEQPQVRRVPPQDENVRHKVVWSGDDGQPMLIADEDYNLPEFCYNKNAVKDKLFSEYSAQYCDTRLRKIEAKLRKGNKPKHPKDYKQYIHPTAEEVAEHQKQATAPPPKYPPLSPFEFDYSAAFETLKEEGTVILQSLTAILDLDPEPEFTPPTHTDGYLADDEASSSSDSNSPSTSQSTIESAQSETAQQVPAINWNDFPSWVREKYENQPEMYRKLQDKASLLWQWEYRKNRFLDAVGLTTLDEVDTTPEDELQKRKRQFISKMLDSTGRGPYKWSNPKWKYDERTRRKQARTENGERRLPENKDYHHKDFHQHDKDWKNKKEWRNGDNSQENHSKEHRYHPQADTRGPSSSKEASSHYKQHSGESHESSEDRYKEHRKYGEPSTERKDEEWKNHKHKKNGDQHRYRESDSDERSSGDGSYVKQYHQDGQKKQYKSKEEYHQDRKYDNQKQSHERRRDSDYDDDDDDNDDHYKKRHHEKHRNDDYRKHEHKEWKDKQHHKHKDEHWKKHNGHKEKKWDDRDRDYHQSKERRR